MMLQKLMGALDRKLSTNLANMQWHNSLGGKNFNSIICFDLQKTSYLVIEFPGSYFNVGLLSL